jgi:hypothetical protein
VEAAAVEAGAAEDSHEVVVAEAEEVGVDHLVAVGEEEAGAVVVSRAVEVVAAAEAVAAAVIKGLSLKSHFVMFPILIIILFPTQNTAQPVVGSYPYIPVQETPDTLLENPSSFHKSIIFISLHHRPEG